MPETPRRLYDIRRSGLVDEVAGVENLSEADLDQIARLMSALVAVRDVERGVAEAAQGYMKLSGQDMRALHALIVASQTGEVMTPGALGALLSISPASTTKLLNRLEDGGHIRRQVHPVDRRAFAIEITEPTRIAAMRSVGRQQVKRFGAAARLSRKEREVVIRFLEEMARDLRLGEADTWAHGEESSDR